MNLVSPSGWMDCWENCAEILCTLSDEQLERILPHMLRWLRNPDWPGAGKIRERLDGVREDVLKRGISVGVRWAAEFHNDEWLDEILDYAKGRRLLDSLDADTFAALRERDRHWRRAERPREVEGRPTMGDFTLSLDGLEHGWVDLTIADGKHSKTYAVSWAFEDSLEFIVESAIALSAGRDYEFEF